MWCHETLLPRTVVVPAFPKKCTKGIAGTWTDESACSQGSKAQGRLIFSVLVKIGFLASLDTSCFGPYFQKRVASFAKNPLNGLPQSVLGSALCVLLDDVHERGRGARMRNVIFLHIVWYDDVQCSIFLYIIVTYDFPTFCLCRYLCT